MGTAQKNGSLSPGVKDAGERVHNRGGCRGQSSGWMGTRKGWGSITGAETRLRELGQRPRSETTPLGDPPPWGRLIRSPGRRFLGRSIASYSAPESSASGRTCRRGVGGGWWRCSRVCFQCFQAGTSSAQARSTALPGLGRGLAQLPGAPSKGLQGLVQQRQGLWRDPGAPGRASQGCSAVCPRRPHTPPKPAPPCGGEAQEVPGLAENASPVR